MALLKCKMCGGQLDIIDNETVVTCEYCGTRQTVPTLDNEKKQNLFNRANRLRMSNEFSKAATIYESIVAEFPEEAEAYWGLCLCKYGIEYVDDPATGKKIPTCHRTSYESIFDDSNFDLALEYADSNASVIYRDEAKEIDRLQREILRIASKEEPFDVFICYKETAEDGQRTKDSVLAQDIYDKLTEKGYKVFFSRITLEDKLGQEYEPFIFSALNSAKVMLAIGTKYEYYNAVWVKNEWSRYLEMMKKDKNKLLIPCYADIDAYDMPQEFRNLQGQDMNKIGFIQDLIRGIGKLIPLEINSQVEKTNGATVSVDSLIKRLFILIERNEKSKALELLDQVLNIQADNGEAYLAGLLIDLNVKNVVELNELTESFEDNLNYQSILKYGNKQLKETLNSSLQQILRNKEQKRLQEVYEKVKFSMDNAKTISDYECAIKTLKTISGYNDASKLIEKCHLEIELLKRKQEEERLEKERLDAQRKIEAEQRAQKTKKILMVVIPLFAICIGCFLFVSNVVIPNNKYEQGINLIENGEYEAGYEILMELRDYKDAKEQINIGKTNQLINLMISDIEPDYSELISSIEFTDQVQKKVIEVVTQYYDEEDYKLSFHLSKLVKDCSDDAMNLYNQCKERYFSYLMANVEIGSSIYFGQYEQDNITENGKEDIEWIVLDKKDNQLFLLSKYVLDEMKFAEQVSSEWDDCIIRNWLNYSFLESSFIPQEKDKIIQSIINSPDFSESRQEKETMEIYYAKKFVTTNDFIFLLSESEVFDCVSISQAKGIATEYAINNGVIVRDDKSCKWWLRTSTIEGIYWKDNETYGRGVDNAVYAYNDYVTEVISRLTADTTGIGVRPAMWIDLSK